MSTFKKGDKLRLKTACGFTFEMIPQPGVAKDKRKVGFIQVRGQDGRIYEALATAFEKIEPPYKPGLPPVPEASPGWLYDLMGLCLGPASEEMRKKWEAAGRGYIEICPVTRTKATIAGKRGELRSMRGHVPPSTSAAVALLFAVDVMGHEPYETTDERR